MKNIKSNKIFYGWYIVAASAINNGIGGSVHWKGFTVFFIPLSQSLGLTSAQTAIPFALSRAENGILGPITGWLLDKYGVKKLMLIGGAKYLRECINLINNIYFRVGWI